ncbi:MAG TPA: Tad domain-containing protein [Caulobacteraceae bacterium]|nr:Tad domain-containing protein [Caulobacteraceae bacterium]
MKRALDHGLRVALMRLRHWRHDGGNVAIITTLMIIPLTFALGLAYDYTMASQRKDQIDGMADAAALGAVTPAEMAQSLTTAEARSKNLFLDQIQTVAGVTFQPSDVVVTGADTPFGATITRNVTVTYKAASPNVFAGILGQPSFNIVGNASATSGGAPNIDFYLLLDDSPSMEIAATQTDIDTMVSHTSKQGGCAFGCHESNPSGSDNVGNPNGEDNYTLARNLGVTLRIDLVNNATQNLMTTAQSTEDQNHATYRTAIYAMDYNFTTLQALTTDLSAAQKSAANIASPIVYNNNCLTKTNCNNDEDSYLDQGLSSANTAMPDPGSGTNNAGDKPQEVLFIVSDGLVDQGVTGSGNCGSSTRMCAGINTLANWCTTIKNRGIRIAFLYTTYYPLTTNAFYNSHIASFQSQIATDAQNCASPGLFFQVDTGGNISDALQTLFLRAVSTARLTQ